MLVKGFKKQEWVTVDEVVAKIRLIPPQHRQGLSAVVYDPNRFYQRSYAAPKSINYKVAGEYKKLPIDHILLYKFGSKQEFTHMLFHEVGHYVYFNLLDSQQRKRWVTEVSSAEGYVSAYAQTNASEDFAECYAFCLARSAKMQPLAKKRHFIRTHCKV